MKIANLTLLILLITACSKKVETTPRVIVQLEGPISVTGTPSGLTNNPTKTISGVVPNDIELEIYNNSSCNGVSLYKGMSNSLMSGINYTITEGLNNIYIKLNNYNETSCYGPYFSYELDTELPKITLDASINPVASSFDLSYLIKGVVSDNIGVPSLSLHKNNTCSDLALYVSSESNYNSSTGITLNNTILNNLSTTDVYAKVVDSASNTICQQLISFTHATTDSSNFCAINNGSSWVDHKQMGQGDSNSPYVICSNEQLKSLANTLDVLDFTRYYIQMTDLNMDTFLSTQSNEFSIGNTTNPFKGHYNGNNKKIRNFKMKDSNKGMFGSLTEGSIKNLELVLGTINVSCSTGCGVLLNKVTATNQSIVVEKIKITGSVVLNNLSSQIFGGLIDSIEVTGSGNFQLNSIHSELNISNISGNVGGVVRNIVAPTATSVYLNSINSIQQWQGGTLSSVDLGGVVAVGTGAIFNNIKSNMNVVLSADNESVGVLSGRLNSVNVNNIFSIGTINVSDSDNLGGSFGQVANVKTKNLVSLVDVVGNNSNNCGKVFGWYRGTGNTVSNVQISNESDFNINNCGYQYDMEDEVDTINNPLYFTQQNLFDSQGLWDFLNTWQENINEFPSLKL